MSSYSSTSLSSYDPASSASSESPSSPSTSPGTSPPSPFPLKKAPSFPSAPLRSPRASLAAPPPQRNRALTLDARPHGIGVDPASLIGKQLTRVRRSRTHPCITLHCSDGNAYQILVVGYDPHYRGVPKVLESDSHILNPRSSQGIADLRLTISHAASITLSDKAFQARPGASGGKRSSGVAGSLPDRSNEDRWTQRHAAFALKFEEEQGWHCVWATMTEYDEQDSEMCVFRNYADVYVDRLHSSAALHPPNSAPSHATTHPRAAPSAMPGPPPSQKGSARAKSHAQSQGQGQGQKGKRKHQKKRKGGSGHNTPTPHAATPKARW